MKVSVVVCTCDRYELISKTIESIRDNTLKPHELIIVDQSDDKDRVKHIVDKFRSEINLILIPDFQKGLSRARNIGWRRATGEIVAYTDDDAYVDSKWLEHISETFSIHGNSVGIAGGKVIPVFEKKNSEWQMPEKWNYLYPAYDRGDYVGEYKNNELPTGVNFIILKEILEKTGGFNERLGVISGKKIQMYGEDSEISLKARRLGYKILYNHNLIIYHPVPLSRQNQEFLNRRMFIEGSTQMYIQMEFNEYSFKQKIKLLVKIIIEYVKIITKYRLKTGGRSVNDSREYQGLVSFQKGKIFVLSIAGIIGIKI